MPPPDLKEGNHETIIILDSYTFQIKMSLHLEPAMLSKAGDLASL